MVVTWSRPIMGIPTPVTLAAVGEVRPCYRNLLTAVDYHPDRWSGPTVAAAAALEGVEALTPSQWTLLLDQIERRLSSLLAEFDGQSGIYAVAAKSSN